MRKHLFYLTNTDLTARMWQRGRLSAEKVFQNDESGWLALSEYLLDVPDVPVFILVDLIEEEFHRDTVPHVYGTTRKNLLLRRLQQLYRDTPFRFASQQGREKTGRRDDFMLFNAQTNAALLRIWLDIIVNRQVPIAGIFSTALLSVALFKKFKLGKEPTLFITHQSSGLRQNFFNDGYLRFSRLTILPSQNPDEVAEAARAEIGKTRLFLANTRQLQRGEALKIVALDNAETLRSMQDRADAAESSDSQYITPEQACRTIGVKPMADQQFLDAVYLNFLATSTPASHYTFAEQSHAYSLWKARIFMVFLSGATLAGCMFFSAANMVEAIDTGNRFKMLEQVTAQDEKHYQEIVASMPKTQTNPHDMKSAVSLHDTIVKNRSTPDFFLHSISQALDRLPAVYLDALNWEIVDAAATAPAPATATPGVAPMSAGLIGVPTRPAETVVIRGEVRPFKDDYRSALQTVQAFSDALQRNQHIQVSLLKLPIDTSSNVALVGQAGNVGAASAKFELKAVWSP